MAQNSTKVVQSYIQELIDKVIAPLKEADTNAQALKAKFVAKNPDLTGTNISAANITALNTFISGMNALATGGVVTTLEGKNVPSHGGEALD